MLGKATIFNREFGRFPVDRFWICSNTNISEQNTVKNGRVAICSRFTSIFTGLYKEGKLKYIQVGHGKSDAIRQDCTVV